MSKLSSSSTPILRKKSEFPHNKENLFFLANSLGDSILDIVKKSNEPKRVKNNVRIKRPHGGVITDESARDAIQQLALEKEQKLQDKATKLLERVSKKDLSDKMKENNKKKERHQSLQKL